MKLFDLLNLRRISGQITALVIVSILVIHLAITGIFMFLRPDRPESPGERSGEVGALVRLLSATPLTGRPALIAGMVQTFPQFDLKTLAGNVAGLRSIERQIRVDEGRDDRAVRGLRHQLGSDYRLLTYDGAPRDEVVIALPDGSMVSARILLSHGGPFWGGPWLLTLGFVIVSLTLLGWWAARALAAPLSSFARAAENFSVDGGTDPLPERGPEEIRSVARALNRMRDRITALIDDRKEMLAAISHDLRTPITRLRLRSEFIEDDVHRRHMLRDLDQMRSMLEAVLSFLRNDRKLEAMTLTDVATTLQLVADQFADTGKAVTYEGPSHAMVMARPDDLHRAVTNLVENAVRFGSATTIRLALSERTVTIDVEDDGPGISDPKKSAMLQPFVRGDNARNMDEASGFGLGLSIARTITEAHGGELSLNDRLPQGLIVRIALPARAQQRAA